jgi:hypothetical protein
MEKFLRNDEDFTKTDKSDSLSRLGSANSGMSC